MSRTLIAPGPDRPPATGRSFGEGSRRATRAAWSVMHDDAAAPRTRAASAWFDGRPTATPAHARPDTARPAHAPGETPADLLLSAAWAIGMVALLIAIGWIRAAG